MRLMRLTGVMLALLPLVALGQVGSPLPSTAFTRDWLRSTNATEGYLKLGLASTNQTTITNWLTVMGLDYVSNKTAIIKNNNSYILSTVTNAIIVGGYSNIISVDNITNYSGHDSFIGAGIGNYVGSIESFVGAGVANTNHAQRSGIVSGYGNYIVGGADTSFVGGGSGNKLLGGCDDGVIGGGYFNLINGTGGEAASFIGGGVYNSIIGSVAGVIVGGGSDDQLRGNKISNSRWAFIGAGDKNSITNSDYASIPAGYGNHITNATGSVAVGGTNYISADGAIVVGMEITNEVVNSVKIGFSTNAILVRPNGVVELGSMRATATTTNRIMVWDAPNSVYDGFYNWASGTNGFVNSSGKCIYYVSAPIDGWIIGPSTATNDMVYVASKPGNWGPCGLYTDLEAAPLSVKVVWEGSIGVASGIIYNGGLVWLTYSGCTNADWPIGSLASVDDSLLIKRSTGWKYLSVTP